MNIDEVGKVMDYCIRKCEISDCNMCGCGNRAENCEGGFIVYLFDIIDTKTLERNNINNILKDLENKYEKSNISERLTLMEYTMFELFINDRYKITKKKDYEENLKLLDEEDYQH